VTARSKAWVCGRCLSVIAGINSAGGMDVFCECCVLSGRGLCGELIAAEPRESGRSPIRKKDPNIRHIWHLVNKQ
jgi:hypothetical protein